MQLCLQNKQQPNKQDTAAATGSCVCQTNSPMDFNRTQPDMILTSEAAFRTVVGPDLHQVAETSYIGASSDIRSVQREYLSNHEEFIRETNFSRFSTQPEHAANWFHTKRINGLGDMPFTSPTAYTASGLTLLEEKRIYQPNQERYSSKPSWDLKGYLSGVQKIKIQGQSINLPKFL